MTIKRFKMNDLIHYINVNALISNFYARGTKLYRRSNFYGHLKVNVKDILRMCTLASNYSGYTRLRV